MPQIHIEAHGTTDAAADTRLVHAITAAGVDIGHRCGGHARCTTCRVRFLEGEPDRMTQAEYDKLADRELLGECRLSCQILADHEMRVEVLMRAQEMGWDDPGPEPADQITPTPEWRSKTELEL